MPGYRVSFPDLLEPGFRKIFDDSFKEMALVFPQLFHVNSSTKQDEKDSAVSGFGLFEDTNEGEQVNYEDPVTKMAAFGSNTIRKFLKLREYLSETTRSEIQRWRRSETIIGASYY